jgi:hypothetical protein
MWRLSKVKGFGNEFSVLHYCPPQMCRTAIAMAMQFPITIPLTDKTNGDVKGRRQEVEEVRIVVHRDRLKLLEYLVPEANEDHEDEGDDETLISTAVIIVL